MIVFYLLIYTVYSPLFFREIVWIYRVFNTVTSILIFKCTEGAGVGDYSFLPHCPHPLSSFDTHARWQPVTQSARSRWSCGKIEDCEQSTFDYSLDRYCSIIHSRFRLDSCALFYYLFKTAVLSSPICSCGFGKETKSHFFFYIVLNMLLQEKKIAFCCCSCFSNEWSRYSDSQEVNFFLFGSSHLSTEENVEIFFYAQQFIKESKRFCFFTLKALFTRDVICMLYVKCRCKPSRWVLQWALGANMY